MCAKCVDIDAKIEFYRNLDFGSEDALARNSVAILIEDLESKKSGLHLPAPSQDG